MQIWDDSQQDANRKVIRNIVFMLNSLASLTEPLVLEDDIPSNFF